MPDVYRGLWRHRWFVLGLTAALVGAAYALTKQEQRQYQASTLVRVVQRIQDPSQALGALATGSKLAQTYAQIVATRATAQRIYERLGHRVPFPAIKVSGTPVQDLDLLTITARAPTPKDAQAVANAAPQALRAFIRETGTLRDQVITVETAQLPQAPSSPNLKLNLALALMLGLILNGGLALLIEMLSDRLPDADELESMTGRPVVASIPQLKFTRRSRLEVARMLEKESTIVPKVESG